MTRVEQLIQRICQAIADGKLPAGSRLPSIRQQARTSQLSPFTVAEAYDRLCLQGWLSARPGSGYYVRRQDKSPHVAPAPLSSLPLDQDWLLDSVYRRQPEQIILAGGGWLPENWYDGAALARAARASLRQQAPASGYGEPQGYLPLREILCQVLAEHGMNIDSQQLVLTQGASTALNLACEALIPRGATVLVDDPGYCNLISALRFRGYHCLGVPWQQDGPDTAYLARLLALHPIAAYFTNPWLHNPTGASYSAATAYQVLKLAHEHALLIIEDNVSAELAGWPQSPLAAMDRLQRVIFISSFSKTMAPALRVGYLAAATEVCARITRLKMLTGMTSPALNESIVHTLLTSRVHRRQLGRLRQRLASAQSEFADKITALGWQLFTPAENGLFAWARHLAVEDSMAASAHARTHGIMLAPGDLFRAEGRSPWFRFNVAHCQNPQFWRFLQQDFLATNNTGA